MHPRCIQYSCGLSCLVGLDNSPDKSPATSPPCVRVGFTKGDLPVIYTWSLSWPKLQLLAISMTRLMTFLLRSPASQDLKNPTCTSGREKIQLRPLTGGWATRHACMIKHRNLSHFADTIHLMQAGMKISRARAVAAALHDGAEDPCLCKTGC